MILLITFLAILGIGIVAAIILVLGGRSKASPGNLPLGCTVVDGKIQCSAYD